MLERITEQEALLLTPLISGDPLFFQKATAFTLTQDPTDPRWEIVTYYSDGSLPRYKLHPLEMMYDIWNEEDGGDERDS